MNLKSIVVFLVGFVLLCGAIWGYLEYTDPQNQSSPTNSEDPGTLTDCPTDCREVVSNNRGPEIPDGFQGEVHPLLHQHAQMELRAYWNPPKVDRLDPEMPPEVRRLYTGVRVAVPSRSYSEKDFSMILPPENIHTAGELWALDPEKFAKFLTQFHVGVSMHCASVGRRPGPDGAFAVLRGVSSSHLDVVFRVHGELDLLPKDNKLRIDNAWYSPACFLGRIVVNRKTGIVEYFRLGVPTEKQKNVHITMLIIEGSRGHHFHHMYSVDRMELVGGNPDGWDRVEWTNQLEMGQVHNKLRKVFYKSNEIEFVPFDRVLAVADKEKKPILAVVLLGALQDQSC